MLTNLDPQAQGLDPQGQKKSQCRKCVRPMKARRHLEDIFHLIESQYKRMKQTPNNFISSLI